MEHINGQTLSEHIDGNPLPVEKAIPPFIQIAGASTLRTNSESSIANLDGVARLYVRDLKRLDPVLIENSEDANYPFLSPDSQSIGYKIAESEN